MRHIVLLCFLMLLPCSFAPPVAPKSLLGSIIKEKVLKPIAEKVKPLLGINDNFVKAYLKRYYMRKSENEFNLAKFIKALQIFFGLTPTGAVNDETMEVMKRSRCGMPDVSEYSTFEGRPRWNKTCLTYKVVNTTSGMSMEDTESAVAKAFQVWSAVIPLNFIKTDGDPDILIFFVSYAHQDGYDFDGPEGTLAHAFGPGNGIGGDCHMDNDETWSKTNKGTNMFIVLAHEFGHSLGMDHSKVRGALMYPTYSYVNTTNYQLPEDDRKGIQSLYGKRKTTSSSCVPRKE